MAWHFCFFNNPVSGRGHLLHRRYGAGLGLTDNADGVGNGIAGAGLVRAGMR
jgi:hypothetical protein